MFSIRPAAHRSDYESAFALIEALAVFEKRPHEMLLNQAQFIADGMANPPLYELTVAEEAETGRIVGSAVHYFAYDVRKGKMVYLDDLMIREDYRQQGIGQQLVKAVLLAAQQAGAVQVRWQVLEWNTAAIRFYEKLGATLDGEWMNCTVSQAVLEQQSS